MQYELWARSKESKVYEFIQSFKDENQFYYMLDQVDKDTYSEAMIVQTEYHQMPRYIMHTELTQEKKLTKKIQ